MNQTNIPKDNQNSMSSRTSYSERSQVIGNYLKGRKKKQKEYSFDYDGAKYNNETCQKILEKYPTFFGLLPDNESIGLCEYVEQFAFLISSYDEKFRNLFYETMMNFGSSKRDAPKCPYFYKDYTDKECYYTGVTFKNFFNTFVFFFETMIRLENIKNPASYVYASEEDRKVEYVDDNGILQSFIDDKEKYIVDVVLSMTDDEIEKEAQILTDLFFYKLPKKKLSLRPRTIFYSEAGIPQKIMNSAVLMAA